MKWMILILGFWTGVQWGIFSGVAAGNAALDEGKDHARRMAASAELFRSKVSVILKAHCLECHGGESVKSGFSLVNREDLLKGGDQGLAVNPENWSESPLLEYVYHRREPFMPAKKPQLSEEALGWIKDWIEFGANYDRPLLEQVGERKSAGLKVRPEDRAYWAYRGLRAVELPAESHHPIDFFLEKEWNERGIDPAGLASNDVLIRRMWLDVIGLPPSPEDLMEWRKRMAGEGEVERMADHLLANPHFGERWARPWLDVVRYAESHGFEHDYDRPHAYHFRDFVIRAFNQDLSYERFVQWQVAGDLIAPENPLALMATGFLGAGVYPTQITISEAERVRYDAMDDMVSTLGSAFLATTIGCARCHDHKFDPIPTENYYSLLSAFTETVRSEVPVETWRLDPGRVEAFEIKRLEVEGARDEYERTELPDRLERWLDSLRGKEGEWVSQRLSSWSWIIPSSLESKSGATFERLEDDSYLVTGPNADFDQYRFVIPKGEGPLSAFRLEALAHESMVRGGPGRASNGNFALTDWSVWFQPADGGEKIRVKFTESRVTFEQKGLAFAGAIDEDARSAWAIDPEFGKNQIALVKVGGNQEELAKAGSLEMVMKFENNQHHQLGRFRLSMTDREWNELGLEEEGMGRREKAELELARMLRDGAVEGERKLEALSYFKWMDEGWRQFNERVEQHLSERPKPETVMICSEGSKVKPMRHHTSSGSIPDFYPRTYFLRRGDVNQKVSEATPGFLEVLTQEEASRHQWGQSGRSSVARWLTDVDHGAGALLARVMVNRIWAQYFGRGIVSTPNDFGFQGDPPSHPDLLEWLAGELVRNEWRLKSIHRWILTSRAYRLGGGENRSESNQIDRENRFFWKREPRRLDGELIRDSGLAVSGLLDQSLYGAGSLDENMKRRSLYFQVKRSRLIPVLQLFDGPDTLSSMGERAVTTTATQALFFMNSEVVREMARGMVAQVRGIASPEDRVKQVFRRTFARDPLEEEVKRSLEFIEHQSLLRADNDSEAWLDWCQALLSMNEFSYVE